MNTETATATPAAVQAAIDAAGVRLVEQRAERADVAFLALTDPEARRRMIELDGEIAQSEREHSALRDALVGARRAEARASVGERRKQAEQAREAAKQAADRGRKAADAALKAATALGAAVAAAVAAARDLQAAGASAHYAAGGCPDRLRLNPPADPADPGLVRELAARLVASALPGIDLDHGPGTFDPATWANGMSAGFTNGAAGVDEAASASLAVLDQLRQPSAA
jgi:hypothetical protein